jgi:hypothetical protein
MVAIHRRVQPTVRTLSRLGGDTLIQLLPSDLTSTKRDAQLRCKQDDQHHEIGVCP